MPHQNPFQHTANAFHAVTGLTINPEHIDLLLRLHRVSNYWGRANKEANTDALTTEKPPVTLGSPSVTLHTSGDLTVNAPAIVNPLKGGQVFRAKLERMEPVGTIEAPLHRPPAKAGERFYITSDFARDPYYPWQIVVICRLKDGSNSYAVNFSGRPTMEEFEEHYVKFDNRTHWVHVNDYTSREKKVVTEEFSKELSQYRNSPKAGPAQEAQAGEELAEGKRFKLTYFVAAGKTTHKLYETEPSAWVISMYSNAHGKAFVTSLQ